MKKTLFLLGIALVLYSCDTSNNKPRKVSETNVERPNFVFFLVDDMGWTDLGCYGSTFYQTPNIDQLAKEGIRFTDAYASSPVCSPTRASIMTGKSPARLNITDWIKGRQNSMVEPSNRLVNKTFKFNLELEEKTIAEALKEVGYQTFFAGKWHIGEDSAYWPEHQGFDINKGGWSKGAPDFRKGYFSPYRNPRLADGPEGEYLTDRLGDESVRFLETVGDNPFLLYLSFYSVHNPMLGKQKKIEKYKQIRDSLRYPYAKKFKSNEPWMKISGTGSWKERLVHDHPIYAAMIESLDENVGKVLTKLDQLNLTENTVVIFTSDNGGLATSEGSPTSNLPLRAGKGWLYEGGIREPLIIRWPDELSAGQTSNTLVTSTDFYPTMLEMAGLESNPEQHQDGRSILAELKGTPQAAPILYWHYPHYSNQGGKPSGAIRQGNFKLIEFYEDMSCELYDLSTDIGERTDLSADMPEKVQELKALLHKWRNESKAVMPKVNPGFDEGYLGTNQIR